MNKKIDFSKLSESFQSLITKPELMFQFFDTLPTPIEIWDSEGYTIYMNQAGMEMCGIKDPSLLIGIYNLKYDKVCIDIMGQEVIDRIFWGESVTYRNFPAPIQDVVDRGVIDEKPWEASTMDLYFLPIWDGDKFVCTICFFTVTSVYKGRADIVDAKKYIDDHWMNDFDPKAVAKSINMSVSQMYRLFKEHAGMPPGDYHKRVKANHIKEKLADKNLTIAQAFAACGEDSRGTYARVFKEVTGMSPKEYRASL